MRYAYRTILILCTIFRSQPLMCARMFSFLDSDWTSPFKSIRTSFLNTSIVSFIKGLKFEIETKGFFYSVKFSYRD